jgi:hypothetical protein
MTVFQLAINGQQLSIMESVASMVAPNPPAGVYVSLYVFAGCLIAMFPQILLYL